MTTPTSDVIDQHENAQVCLVQFRTFGLERRTQGSIRTVRCHDDNSLVRKMLLQPAHGDILVVDGRSSYRSALLGDNMAGMAIANGWAGVIVLGCIRDSQQIDQLKIHVKALGVCPRKSAKLGVGESEVPIEMPGVTFRCGEYLYSDSDGIVVLPARPA